MLNDFSESKLYELVTTFEMDGIKNLKWSEEREPDNGKTSYYNHVMVDTPLGKIMIEWKGWKIADGRVVYLDGYYICVGNDTEEAKRMAEYYIVTQYLKIKEFVTNA